MPAQFQMGIEKTQTHTFFLIFYVNFACENGLKPAQAIYIHHNQKFKRDEKSDVICPIVIGVVCVIGTTTP